MTLTKVCSEMAKSHLKLIAACPPIVIATRPIIRVTRPIIILFITPSFPILGRPFTTPILLHPFLDVCTCLTGGSIIQKTVNITRLAMLSPKNLNTDLPNKPILSGSAPSPASRFFLFSFRTATLFLSSWDIEVKLETTSQFGS